MTGRGSGREVGASRRFRPIVEGLDRRELLSAGGVSKSLGPYVSPSPLGPKANLPAKAVNPHSAIQQFLATILGPGLGRLQAKSALAPRRPAAVLRSTVLGQPFVRGVFSDQDTYQLLRSSTFNGLIGSQQISGATGTSAGPSTSTDSTTPTSSTGSTAPTSSTAAASSVSTASPTVIPGTIPSTTPGTTPGTSATTMTSVPGTTPGVSSRSTGDPLVAFSIPEQAVIQSIEGAAAVIQVKPAGGALGFFATVPTSNIRVLDEGPPVTGSVLIASSRIPSGFPTPPATVLEIGTFSSTYATTAPLLNQIFNAKLKGVAPNAPESVPGLRLAPYLAQNNPFPNQKARKELLKAFRVAVQRNVFRLNDAQADALSEGVSQFIVEVQAFNAAGGFVPVAPVDPPSLPSGPLMGTLQVSAGVVRELPSVAPSVSGLAIPGLGNFPGRFDVGYVFDRAGNFGVALTVRGVLTNANPGQTPVDVAAGDLRVEVTDAQGLDALTGLKVVEGVGIGSLISANLENARYQNGVASFGATAGNGFGLEYGTGVGYTRVIPLGNVYSLIPASPRR